MAKKEIQVQTQFVDETVKVKASTRDFEIFFDEPSQLGGKDTAPKPTEVLLASLAACKMICAKLYAPKYGIHLQSLEVDCFGESNPDGFGRKDPQAKVGLTKIKTLYKIKANNSDQAVKEFISFIESACPVKDTLVNTPQLEEETVIK